MCVKQSMRQTTKRTTVFENDTTKVIVEVQQEIPTPILDELYRHWWKENCEADWDERELTNILGPNWRKG